MMPAPGLRYGGIRLIVAGPSRSSVRMSLSLSKSAIVAEVSTIGLSLLLVMVSSTSPS